MGAGPLPFAACPEPPVSTPPLRPPPPSWDSRSPYARIVHVVRDIRHGPSRVAARTSQLCDTSLAVPYHPLQSEIPMKFRPIVPLFAVAPLLACSSSPVVPSGPPDAQTDASPVVDATTRDTSVSDTSVSDSRPTSSDSSAVDDSTTAEAATSGSDASRSDASKSDASSSDASSSDAASSDAPSSDASNTGPVPISGWNAATAAIPSSPFLVVDQFGYRTTAEKIAVARSPVTGFDTPASFTPSATLDVVDVTTGQSVWSGAPVAWNSGAVDSDTSHGSGDKTWWLTFTALTTPGTYVVVDTPNKVRSYPFQISDTVYATVFKAAQKMYYYQRFGIAKDAQYAGAQWADGVAFPGDTQCVDFLTKSNPKDLSGGWFDAGDYDKYTNWSAADVMLLLRAYSENPSAFTDDVNIPESGNGVPDILDEVKWELDWMKRMQDGAGSNGSVLSVVGEVGASNPIWSPPSASNATCAYGEASTSATLSTAWAFAYASMVYKNIPSLATYAADLLMRAQNAWTWAQANPSVQFFNNDSSHNTSGLASGQQEVNAASLAEIQLQAAALLFAATGTQAYQAYVDANYDANSATTSLSGYVGPWDTARYEALLTYAISPGATATVASSIKTNMLAGINGGDNFPGYTGNEGSYGPYLAQFVWGSNQTQAQQGLIFTMVPTYGLDATKNTAALTAAERHVHYFHGVNPLSKVYLSNLSTIGASNSVTSFFHSWFAPGTKWSAVTATTPGPAPGFLVGGPNPSYSLDGCCPSNCGASNALCMNNPVPPAGQPPMKAYKDFNDGWPLDSWSVTEPDLGYQAAYVRLLSKFVKN